MSWMNRCYDMVRIDHFRAFDTYWKIPESCPTAIEGKWILGPAHKLMDAILKACPDIVLVAEDLGLIRPEVIELEEDYGIPGMDVLLFRMEAKQLKKGQRKTLYYIQEHMIMRHAMRIIIRMIQISVLVCVVSLKTKAIQAVPLMKCCVSLR